MQLLRLKFTLFKKYKKVHFLFELLDNACGCMYFINHKTKDYFTEDAGLLDLSVSTLKELKSHDSKLLSGDTLYSREDYHRKHPTGTQLPEDVPWRFSKGCNTLDLQKVGGLSGEQYKNWWFCEKNCYSEVRVRVLHICFCFLSEEQIFKSFKWGRPWTSTRPSCGTSMGPNDGTF